MKRSFLVLVFALVATTSVVAQLENNPKSADKKPKVDWSKTNVYKRAADHFMFQFGYAGWSGHGDTMNIGGFSRTANVYLMFDFPFKSNPHFSAAVGAGVGSDNIFFKKTTIDIKHQSGILFTADTLTKYKKYKLNTSFFEIPVELRWSARPDNMNKGFKAALGMKLGILWDAKTNEKIEVVGGALGARTLDADGIKALADLPSLDTLRAGLLGMISTPATRIAGVLAAPGGQIARVLAAFADKNGAPKDEAA